MQILNLLQFVAVTLAFCASAANAAPDLTCRAGKEPGLSYHGDRVKLPPLAQRKILGTWLHTDNHLAVSLEAAGNSVYEVVRSQYCTSGSHGRRLNASQGGVYPLGRGEYYRIEPNGDLGVYDGDGRFDVYTRRSKVFAD
jgi:hypothetical protein